MSNQDIVRAWKDEDYWHSLSEEMRSRLPENPAGIIELSDEQMELIVGGLKISSRGNCTINSNHSQVCITKQNFNCLITKVIKNGVCINRVF
ncbi:hypothetical protein Sta7437_1218 [Stanieria cyanosphaera PCC 7437]|uniref:Uncharacterized protein n=1 Tax=Stanieria cyanosphaera (strain ATCC 29371 / PCC 7437) TaxID=111780 RepID=K9XQJ2_STAC7|nr:mersacidin/lichenicidin family type 2 lantibiotic [Stanieria cyanosphaera]AFZ34788.1 hypothetical protein Sta7437_1218 [Stanieria cyanosphaera PCC 7437]